MAMRELGLPYRELCWALPWGTVLRMLADLPGQVYHDEDEDGKPKPPARELTAQTSADFKDFINNLNKKKQKHD